VLRDVFTRSGPGMGYPTQGGGLGRDQVVTVLGRDRSENWYLVQPAVGAPVWVGAEYLEATAGGLKDVLPAATIPPLPTSTPTPTPLQPTNTPPPSSGGNSGSGPNQTPVITNTPTVVVPD
jgi:hypothetical protein